MPSKLIRFSYVPADRMKLNFVTKSGFALRVQYCCRT